MGQTFGGKIFFLKGGLRFMRELENRGENPLLQEENPLFLGIDATIFMPARAEKEKRFRAKGLGYHLASFATPT